MARPETPKYQVCIEAFDTALARTNHMRYDHASAGRQSTDVRFQANSPNSRLPILFQ